MISPSLISRPPFALGDQYGFKSLERSFPRHRIYESQEQRQQAYRVVDQQSEHLLEGERLFRLKISTDRPNPQTFVSYTKKNLSPSQKLSAPVLFILRLLENWKLEESDAVYLLGFEDCDSDYISDVLKGYEELKGRDVKDRISILLYLRKSLWLFFQNLEVENEWLRESQVMLDERKPLSLLESGSMEDLLLLREYVDAITGM